MAEENATTGNKEPVPVAPPNAGAAENARYEDLVAALQHAEAHLETLRRLTGTKSATPSNSKPATAPSLPPANKSQSRTAPAPSSSLSQPTPGLLQDIEHEWGATLVENRDLKATLHALLQQQQILVERQQATDELLAHKDVVLQGIQEAVQELKQALVVGSSGRPAATSRNVKSKSGVPNNTTMAVDSIKAAKEQQAAKEREAQAKEQERQHRIAMEQSLQAKQAELATLQSTLQQYDTAYQQATEQKQSLEQALAEANALLENHKGMKQQLEHALNAATSEVTSLARVFREMEPLENQTAATNQTTVPISTSRSAPKPPLSSISHGQPPPLPIVETVISNHDDDYDDYSRNPQDDYYQVLSLDPEAAKQGGMAYLQQQMAQVTAYPLQRQVPPSSSSVPRPATSSRPFATAVSRKFPLQPQMDVRSTSGSNAAFGPPRYQMYPTR